MAVTGFTRSTCRSPRIAALGTALLMTLLAARGGTVGAAAAADSQQLARSHLFSGAARELLQRPAVSGEKAEVAALYAAEAARLARGDDGQLGAALPLLREALRHLAGTPLRIHARLEAGDPEEISSITVSGDGALIACGTTGGLVYVWRVGRDGAGRLEKLLVTAAVALPQLAHEPVEQVQLLFQDRWLVLVTASGRVRALDATQAFAEVEVPPEWQPNAGITAGSESALVGIIRPEGSAIDVWQLKDKAPHKLWSYSDPVRPVRAASFSADGRLLLLTHDSSEVRILEAATGKVSRALSLPAPDVMPAARSGRDSFRVYLGPPDFRADISSSGQALIMQETRRVQHVSTRPDGLEEVVEAPSVETGTWDLSGPQPEALRGCFPDLTALPPTQVGFSRNNWLAAAYGRRLMLLDLPTLRDITRERCYKLEREAASDVTGVAFDREGRVAVSTMEGFVELRKLGNPDSMAHPLVIAGFSGAVPEIAQREPRMLLYGGLEHRHGQLIRVCDLDRDCLPHEAPAAAGADGLLALARRLVARNLTVAEWKAVLPSVPYERTFDEVDDVPLMRSLVDQAGSEAVPATAQGAMQRALDAARVSGNPYALAGIARTALDLQMFDIAAAAADALVQMLPADPAALWYRGQARALMGDKAAIADLQAYIDWQRAHQAPRTTLRWEQDAIQLLQKGETPVPRQ